MPESDPHKEMLLESAKEIVRDFARGMENATPEDAERKAARLKALCTIGGLLPDDFREETLDLARDLECAANMRKCDALLREARILSVGNRIQERQDKLQEAQAYYNRAYKLGADDQWCKDFVRATEALRSTGKFQRGAQGWKQMGAARL